MRSKDTEESPRDSWEVTGGHGSEEKTIRCAQCGDEFTINAPLALAKDRVECSECGAAKKLNTPSPMWALLLLIGALVYVQVRAAARRIDPRV